jgi:tRNA threonylcarbamoyladenosine biosynthesis protein TsaB
VQGLAFATGRPVVGVSALDALALTTRMEPTAPRPDGASPVVAAWMDAQRGEVYAALYRCTDRECVCIDGPTVGTPDAVVEQWGERLPANATFVGDGVLTYRELVVAARPGSRIVETIPAIAGSIAELGRCAADLGLAVAPHAIKPLYVRRPDAELVRDRRTKHSA